MYIIIFQCIPAGKTEVSEECFIQNENTNFFSNTSFLSRKSCSLKITKTTVFAVGLPYLSAKFIVMPSQFCCH